MSLKTATAAYLIACWSVGAWAQTPSLRAGTVFRDCPQCPQMVLLPSGSFTVGSQEQGRGNDEGPQTSVTIAPLAVSKFEVTRREYGEFVRESGHDAGNECFVSVGANTEKHKGKSWANPGYRQSDAHPVACVSWNDANAYAAWLSRKTGKTYRLLSEAEWEYAASGEEHELCHHGNGPDLTTKEAGGPPTWSYAQCRDHFGLTTAPVGSFSANRFGLHDMHGNVWEWVEDCYQESHSSLPSDGSAAVSGDCQYRVYRGGGWAFAPWSLATRYRHIPDSRSSVVGFRLARSAQ